MSIHRLSWPLSLVYFFAASTLAVQSLDVRSEQTEAQCSTAFDWASNSIGLTPCSLSAYVFGSCFSGNWNVPQLPPSGGFGYTTPNSTTANLCTCSWAAYNLISACTACQGLDPDVDNWAFYNQNCSDFFTDAYFPSNVTLPVGTAIPFWAATNHKPDIVQGQSSNKKKTPVGAIAGGVVGGVMVLIIGGIAFWFIRKRNQTTPAAEESGVRPYYTRPQIHGRSASDLSGKSILGPMSVSMYSYLAILRYTSPVRAMSPPLPVHIAPRDLPDVIEPFTSLRPTSPPVSMPSSSIARKTSGTTLRSTATSEPPAAVVVHERYAPDNSDHARRNPPPYSPSAAASPATSPEPTDPNPQPSAFVPGHRNRSEKASVDTHTSYDSGTSHNGGESVTGIDEVIGRMGLIMSSPESVMGSTVGPHTVATGQSANVRATHKANVSNPDNDPVDRS
ncbi:hypothetical protein K438DRAFT_1972448 [Mycena galopus ATCC 62051]|nr:hypothetical protein K438DRAFT_1972448 [Mycena galopus ATCC 62051]